MQKKAAFMTTIWQLKTPPQIAPLATVLTEKKTLIRRLFLPFLASLSIMRGPPWNPLDYHSTIVSGGFKSPLNWAPIMTR